MEDKELIATLDNRDENFVALREAFVALAHSLAHQGILDLDVFRKEMKAAANHLQTTADEPKAAVLLESFSTNLLADLENKRDIAAARRKRDLSRSQQED